MDGVSLRLDEGKPEIVTVIGESGSGKTTLARMILNMVPPSAGAIRFRGTDLREVRGTRARLDFMRQVQPIFQNPFEAFNPMKRVDRYLFATARHMAGLTTQAAIEAEADRALAMSACRWPRCAGAIRTSCRAASCSAWRSRAPWFRGRPCWWPTSRCR